MTIATMLKGGIVKKSLAQEGCAKSSILEEEEACSLSQRGF